MLFNVKVVSREDYDAYVADLEATGQTSDKPVLGGEFAYTPVGLGEEEESE